jgi:hypothetical protein
VPAMRWAEGCQMGAVNVCMVNPLMEF